MNPSLLVAFVVLLAGSGVQSQGRRPGAPPRGGPGGPPPPPPGESNACAEALAPTAEERDALRAASQACMTQALADRMECMASELGLLNDDGSFNQAALEQSILDKVTGLDIEANTQLGLDNCPDVEDFNVPAFLSCVNEYCMNG